MGVHVRTHSALLLPCRWQSLLSY